MFFISIVNECFEDISDVL